MARLDRASSPRSETIYLSLNNIHEGEQEPPSHYYYSLTICDVSRRRRRSTHVFNRALVESSTEAMKRRWCGSTVGVGNVVTMMRMSRFI